MSRPSTSYFVPVRKLAQKDIQKMRMQSSRMRVTYPEKVPGGAPDADAVVTHESDITSAAAKLVTIAAIRRRRGFIGISPFSDAKPSLDSPSL